MRMKQIAGFGLVVLMVASSADSPRAAGVAAVTLIDTIKKHDVATTRTLLKERGAANAATADGTTPLHWATDLDDYAIAELLVRSGANVKAANRYGVTPMYSAAVNGNAKMIALLLDAGADPNVPLAEGETPLMTAAKTGKVEAIRVLLARGAAVNAKETWKQQSALMWAAHEGNAEAVTLLIDAGANVNDRSMFGWTQLLFAARQGQIAAIDALVAGGARINDTLPDGTSALVTAVQGQNYEAAYALLRNGIDPNASKQGWTALHQIAWSRRPQRGQNNPGQKPLGDVSSLELARTLVEFGADINARQTREPNSDMEGRNSLNRYGATPFFLAAKSVDVPLMQALLELGADPFIGNVDGDTPLMVAAGVGVYSQGESPGLPEESADAVKMLLDLGAPVNELDKHGETAMHGPAWRGSNEAVMLLVNAGERLDVRNDRGWLPLTIADGVYYNARVMMNKHTAKLLREQMVARGLDASDKDANLGGAIRSEVEDENAVDARNPSEIQERLLEQQKQRQEALKQLPGRGN
jgi:ankyrin repeat protein